MKLNMELYVSMIEFIFGVLKTMVLEAVWVPERLQVASSDKLSENTAVDIHLSDGTDHYSGGQIIHVAGGPNSSSHAGYFI